MISSAVLMNLTVATRAKSSLCSPQNPPNTDDTVMTLAVGLAFLDAQPGASDDWILQTLANRMRQFGNMYPNAGYGGMFLPN